MTNKERRAAACEGKHVNHIPLRFWCFGLSLPNKLLWESENAKQKYWFSHKMEHIHTVPSPWMCLNQQTVFFRWIQFFQILHGNELETL